MMSDIATFVGSGVISLAVWIGGKKWLIPAVINIYKKWRDDALKRKADLQSVEQAGNDIYQSQIKFLNDEINSLQNMVRGKTEELNSVYTELSRLRQRLKDLELSLINAKEDLQLFASQCCSKEDCPLRVPCAGVNKIMQKYVEDYNEGKEVVDCDCDNSNK